MNVLDTHITVAIDGPSGAGKSTIARAAARRFGLIYVDTGAIYRTVGLAGERAGGCHYLLCASISRMASAPCGSGAPPSWWPCS